GGAFLGDLLVGGVDLLHLLLGQIRQGIVVVVVRMILPGQLPVCFFDLLVGGVLRYAQDLIGIVHVVSFLCFFLCSLGGILWKVPSSTARPTAKRAVYTVLSRTGRQTPKSHSSKAVAIM